MQKEIITIKEARKLLGRKVSKSLTDLEVQDLIIQLDYIATLAIRDYKSKNNVKENKNES